MGTCKALVPEDSDGRTALLPEKRRMIHTAEIIHSQFSSFWLSERWEWQAHPQKANLLNRIREAAVVVTLAFQRLHMQRFAVLPRISEGMKWEQLDCWRHDFPCPHDAVHLRIFMFCHCYSRWRRDRVKHPTATWRKMRTLECLTDGTEVPPRRSGWFCSWTIDKTGELSLTAVGDGKTVGHFQIVNVRRQPEFGGAKLNHSYPKRAVFLIRAPWKQAPCNRQQQGIL